VVWPIYGLDESAWLSEIRRKIRKVKMTKDVIVIIGAGGIGQAIARRQGYGKTVLLADNNPAILAEAALSTAL
jgi:phosphoglycerate dehydrogenase-like enzyme